MVRSVIPAADAASRIAYAPRLMPRLTTPCFCCHFLPYSASLRAHYRSTKVNRVEDERTLTRQSLAWITTSILSSPGAARRLKRTRHNGKRGESPNSTAKVASLDWAAGIKTNQGLLLIASREPLQWPLGVRRFFESILCRCASP